MKVVSEIQFFDPDTRKNFNAQVVENNSDGQKGYLVPMWVKSDPKEWVRIKHD